VSEEMEPMLLAKLTDECIFCVERERERERERGREREEERERERER
jgi:hypothetical protein